VVRILASLNPCQNSTEKISIIAITRRFSRSLRCTKSSVILGFAPDPIGELTALPRLPRWIEGQLCDGGGKEAGDEGERKGGEGGRERNLKGLEVGPSL